MNVYNVYVKVLNSKLFLVMKPWMPIFCKIIIKQNWRNHFDFVSY